MSYTPKTISEVISDYLNRNTYLPAIQREYVWEPFAIEKLFDSIMGDYPISSFLFWKIREENKSEWTAYEFIRDFDQENPHNKEANVSGVNQDIFLVLDGQQRLTSLFIGLKGTYRYFHYSWKKTRLYLNLLRPSNRSDDPEELTYQFEFREDDKPNLKEPSPQYWYLVGNILNFDDAEEAKKDIKSKIAPFPEDQRDNANSLVGRLHSKIHTARLLNYYEEKSQDYNKVVEVFIRANTGGKKLEYSDILLSTATAKWKNLNAREEIHSFTDEINKIGGGYTLGKDFVLKGCLYLTDGLSIKYKVKNFNNTNLEKIENNWEVIKSNIRTSVQLVSKFGFSDHNLVSAGALLPIALYLKKRGKKNFVESSDQQDVKNQSSIQKWLITALLKNSFGSSSDTVLKDLQDVLLQQEDYSTFPTQKLNFALDIVSSFTDYEIERFINTPYSSKYSYLILSLLYPDRDWKDNKYHEDHIFPKTEFTEAKLKQGGFDSESITFFRSNYNTIGNLQLLTDKENLEKNAKPFDKWLASRDDNFKTRHTIPSIGSYDLTNFEHFILERKKLIKAKLQSITQ